MIGHLRYLGGCYCPSHIFILGSGAKSCCPYRPRRKSERGVRASRELYLGRVRVDPLFKPDNDISVSGAYVTFEPGARSAWHTHPAGQRLIVDLRVLGSPNKKASRCRLSAPVTLVLPGGRQTLAWGGTR